MNRDDAKRAICEHPERFFTKAKHGGYICPNCGNGEGRDGTGITKDKKTGKYKCFKCEAYGDVLDFIGYKYNLSSFNDKLRRGCEIYGIQYDDLTSDNIPQLKKADDTPAPKKEPFTKLHKKTRHSEGFCPKNLITSLCNRRYILQIHPIHAETSAIMLSGPIP